MDRNCSDDSEIEEERAGGGPGPTGGGPEQEDRGRIRDDDGYLECWRSTHLLDDGGDTRRARGYCMCDLHMHMYRYDRAEVVLTLFRSINSKVPLNSRFEGRNKRIGNGPMTNFPPFSVFWFSTFWKPLNLNPNPSLYPKSRKTKSRKRGKHWLCPSIVHIQL